MDIDHWLETRMARNNGNTTNATKINNISSFKVLFGDSAKNLGYFTWNDDVICNVEPKKITAELLISSVIDDHIEKPPLINYSEKKKIYDSNEITNLLRTYKVPKGEPKIKTIPYKLSSNTAMTLHIAQKRGLDLNNVDFLLGGSSLSVLA